MTDPFAAEPLTDFIRGDRYGNDRPQVLSVGEFGSGDPEGDPRKRVGMQRPSSFSDLIEDHYGIHVWDVAHVLLGTALDPTIVERARPLNYDDDKAFIRALADEARAVARKNDKANWGTAVHSQLNPRRNPFADPLDEAMQADVASARALMEREFIEETHTEAQVVNDDVGAAGTFDKRCRLRRLGGDPVIVDIKTGKKPSLLSWTMQLTTYADGCLYDVRELLGVDPRSDLDVNPDWAVVVWTPKGIGESHLIPIDLNEGRELLRIALRVRETRTAAWRKRLEGKTFPTIAELLERCKTIDDVRNLWRSCKDMPEWDVDAAAAKAASL